MAAFPNPNVSTTTAPFITDGGHWGTFQPDATTDVSLGFRAIKKSDGTWFPKLVLVKESEKATASGAVTPFMVVLDNSYLMTSGVQVLRDSAARFASASELAEMGLTLNAGINILPTNEELPYEVRTDGKVVAKALTSSTGQQIVIQNTPAAALGNGDANTNTFTVPTWAMWLGGGALLATFVYFVAKAFSKKPAGRPKSEKVVQG